ncbi:MAG TPA: peptide chain release factor N(5)-glutamine methyltransferase [Methylotenera sp.]|nr:peptide chain release factor N(5)-glutamine methyltransferase [Methylotenera sp.]
MTIEAALHDAQAALAKFVNSSEAKLEAQLLLKNLLNVNRAWLISHQNDALEANINEAYRVLINRRLNGEPIAYILGAREFYGLNLKVTPATLIPRPDTETLVDAALAKIPLQKKLNICDLGTGSGAIALAIAKHRPQAFVLALDASQVALDIAIENAQSLGIANLKFILSDWFNALKNEKFDIIVSNPPYIEADDALLSLGDLRFEPLSALASGQDGLDDIRSIISQAPQHLNPHGWLLLEHGYNQAEKVAALLKQAGFNQISQAQDLAGIERVTLGCIAP